MMKDYELYSVMSARAQVVAGWNYELKLKFEADGALTTHTARVYVPLTNKLQV